MANQVLFNEDTYTRCLAEVPKVNSTVFTLYSRGNYFVGFFRAVHLKRRFASKAKYHPLCAFGIVRCVPRFWLRHHPAFLERANLIGFMAICAASKMLNAFMLTLGFRDTRNSFYGSCAGGAAVLYRVTVSLYFCAHRANDQKQNRRKQDVMVTDVEVMS